MISVTNWVKTSCTCTRLKGWTWLELTNRHHQPSRLSFIKRIAPLTLSFVWKCSICTVNSGAVASSKSNRSKSRSKTSITIGMVSYAAWCLSVAPLSGSISLCLRSLTGTKTTRWGTSRSTSRTSSRMTLMCRSWPFWITMKRSHMLWTQWRGPYQVRV